MEGWMQSEECSALSLGTHRTVWRGPVSLLSVLKEGRTDGIP